MRGLAAGSRALGEPPSGRGPSAPAPPGSPGLCRASAPDSSRRRLRAWDAETRRGRGGGTLFPRWRRRPRRCPARSRGLTPAWAAAGVCGWLRSTDTGPAWLLALAPRLGSRVLREFRPTAGGVGELRLPLTGLVELCEWWDPLVSSVGGGEPRPRGSLQAG